METLLINQNDFLPYRALCDNIDTAKRLEPHVTEAQRLDVMKLLGATLYFDLIANVTAVRAALSIDSNYQPTETQQHYIDLLDGKTYDHTGQHSDTITKVYPGLKPVLVYFSYGRFVNSDNVRSTPSGFVIKTNMESQPLSATQLREQAGRAEQDARAFWVFVEEYMKDFTFFDKYKNNTCDNTGRNSLSGGRLGAARNKNKISRR